MRCGVIGRVMAVSMLLSACVSVPEQSLQMANKAYDANQYAEAKRYYEQVPEQARSAEIWFRYGNALSDQGQIEQAIFAYQRSLALDPTLSHARHNLGVLELKQGIKHLIEARRALPGEDVVYQQLAELLQQLADLVYGQ